MTEEFFLDDEKGKCMPVASFAKSIDLMINTLQIISDAFHKKIGLFNFRIHTFIN